MGRNYDALGNRYGPMPARGNLKKERPFRGVDGEGGNVAEPGTLFGERHQYLSLRIGPELLETGEPLSWRECFSFIADQSPDYIYVSYFFDYDVTMMIRTLPEERARRLLYPALREHEEYGRALPVDVDEFQIDYMPHKCFQVRRKGGKWIVIQDVGQFFQSSFLNTLKKWNIGTPAELAMIEKGKKDRSSFTQTTAEIRAYNALGVLLLEQLMEEFRDVCEATGYVPRRWQGPGYLASAMLDKHGVPKRDEIPILQNAKFKALAQAAYYGGRFETTAVGPIHRAVYQYDINGAYVAALRTLPCLLHGTWRWVHDRPSGKLWFGKIHFDHDGGRYLYNLPVRLKDHSIKFPKEAEGVYWNIEIEAAERGGTRTDFLGGWEYSSSCSCRWFDFVESYYRERVRLGKSAKGYVLKLAGNSIYGKLAQSIGYAPWANPVWAGIITATCRAQLIDAYMQAPEHCYMLATDGLFMGRPLNVPVSAELGQWEQTIHDDGIFIVQPGVYFTGAEAKSRGVERGILGDLRTQFEHQFEYFIESKVDQPVPVKLQNFTGAKIALQRRKWRTAGTWNEITHEVGFSCETKRKAGYLTMERENGCDIAFRSWPPEVPPGTISVAYDRMIGGGLRHPEDEHSRSNTAEEAERMRDQPDWVDNPLFTRDGIETEL